MCNSNHSLHKNIQLGMITLAEWKFFSLIYVTTNKCLKAEVGEKKLEYCSQTVIYVGVKSNTNKYYASNRFESFFLICGITQKQKYQQSYSFIH